MDGRDGDDATDSYRLWKEDIALLVQYGVKSYRLVDPVNPKGIQWYSILIDALLANGIITFVVCPPPAFTVTLEVTESPCLDLVSLGPATDAARQIRWMGMRLSRITFATIRVTRSFIHSSRCVKVSFEAFGDRVKHWCALRGVDRCSRAPYRQTMSELWCISVLGYGRGVFAPGKSSDRERFPEDDSTTEP